MGIGLVTLPLAAAIPHGVAAENVEPAADSERVDDGRSAPQPSDHPQSGAPAPALAAPLAAALRAIHAQYAGAAKPVPPDVRERLAAEYGAELARARYVVSKLAIDVLAAFDRFQGTSLGDGLHAVTVDDLIVFSSAPSLSDLWMWAHELHHVRQYQERGTIDAFVRWYLSDCQAVEQAADERANRALGMTVRLRHCLG